MRPWRFIKPEYDPLVKEVMILECASNRTLASRLGWSETKTSRHVDYLESKGLVRKLRAGQSVAITVP
jgi:DNA-binding MarR family transcriptional regulator